MTPPVPPIPPEEEDADLMAAEYALRLLTPAEAVAFEARMLHDPTLRAALARWTEEFGALAADSRDEPPPANVWRGVEARLFPEERQGWLRRLGVIPALVAGLVAALLLLAVGQGWFQPAPQGLPAGGMPVRIAAADGSLVVDAMWDDEADHLMLMVMEGAPPPGREMELWLIAGDGAPVSLGMVHQDGMTVIEPSQALAALMPGATLAISDEPPGGSPSGQPTGTVMATGQVAA